MPEPADRVYVTGASGFLGRSVCRALADAGRRVVPVSRRPLALANNKVVSDYAALKPETASALVHLAEPAAIPHAETADPSKAAKKALDALLAQDWSAVVYASSAAVYGDADDWPHTEDEARAPAGAYARMKLDGEHAVRQRGGTALRFSNIIGAPAKPRTVLSAILDQLGGQDPVALRSLAPVRDFLCVEDAAQAVAAALAGPPGIYNIASGKALTIGEFARLVLGLAGEPDRPVRESAPGLERSVLRVSNDAARTQLGWSPQISLDDCLRALLKAPEGSL